jgi:hypothetical protein
MTCSSNNQVRLESTAFPSFHRCDKRVQANVLGRIALGPHRPFDLLEDAAALSLGLDGYDLHIPAPSGHFTKQTHRVDPACSAPPTLGALLDSTEPIRAASLAVPTTASLLPRDASLFWRAGKRRTTPCNCCAILRRQSPKWPKKCTFAVTFPVRRERPTRIKASVGNAIRRRRSRIARSSSSARQGAGPGGSIPVYKAIGTQNALGRPAWRRMALAV